MSLAVNSLLKVSMALVQNSPLKVSMMYCKFSTESVMLVINSYLKVSVVLVANSCCVPTAPGSHIERLYARWESALSEEKRLKEQIAELEARHEDNLRLRLDSLEKEMLEKQVDAVEKAKLEGQFHYRLAVSRKLWLMLGWGERA